MSERLLIVGVDGSLGGTLRRHLQQSGREVAATSLLRVPDPHGVIHLDLTQPPETWPELPACRAVVLCAAITNLEQCRANPAATRLVNVTRSLALLERLAARGAFVVFISSNLVFDGSKPMRQLDEPVCPRTEYGRQKAEAETALLRLRDQAAIVRLTKVIHPDLPLMRGWVQSLREGKPISPFQDFVCSPITLDATIGAIAEVATQRRAGIWQLSASADITYAGIAQQLAARGGFNPALVQPVSARSAALEHLPQHSTLDSSRPQRELGFELLDPESVIDRVFSPPKAT